MAQNDEVLEKYREGKANLDQLLQERRGLLERFRVLIGHARDLSTSDTIIKFDVVKAQDLCTALTDVETRIDSLIADVNAYAEKCGKDPIQVQTIDS